MPKSWRSCLRSRFPSGMCVSGRRVEVGSQLCGQGGNSSGMGKEQGGEVVMGKRDARIQMRIDNVSKFSHGVKARGRQ